MIAILDYICLGFKANIRKDAGVVERGGLEIRYTALLYPGFESLSFRKATKHRRQFKCAVFRCFLPLVVSLKNFCRGIWVC